VTERHDYLFTGGAGQPLLPALRNAILKATDIEIAVSFIQVSGLDLIFGDLEAALLSDRQVKLTLLTSDYLCITDPRALRKLMLLAERGADIRIFQVGTSHSFHIKAYVFVQTSEGQTVSADAFVGSSNISKTALTDGLEWNYHIDFPNNKDLHAEARLQEIRQKFSDLLHLKQVARLNYPWIEQYELRYKQAAFNAVIPEVETVIRPLTHQAEALMALDAARKRGISKGLVILATGLGKTYLAALDVAQTQAKRAVFIAHREEILLQAEASFMAVLPHLRIGRFTGKQKDTQYDLLFASVQTLGRQDNLEKFQKDFFDYVVIDEFHHAAAKSYQKIIGHFTPKFMLGLTATPERTDQSDIIKLCDNNVIYRMDLFEGIEKDHLCPFNYYGIYDGEVDYEHIPWRNGRFDPSKLSNQLATLSRAKHIFKEWKEKAQTRTLAFCVSKSHADFMANYFNGLGIAAASVHASSSVSRSSSIEELSDGRLQVIFSVDLFNEGIDVPSLDTVMMLRPTESKILFLQQLGRGLRKFDAKSHLTVLDFIGNHHSFLNRPELLLSAMFEKKPTRKQLYDAVEGGSALLPDGCFVTYDLEFVNFLKSLMDNNLTTEFLALRESLGRRPTILEMWRSGSNLANLNRQYGSWWEFLDEIGEATPDEAAVLENFAQWFRDLSTTKTVKSYKLVLLQTLLSQGTFIGPNNVQDISKWALDWYKSNPLLQQDLPASLLPIDSISDRVWLAHWLNNPIKFWCTAERSGEVWFDSKDSGFCFTKTVLVDEESALESMTTEIMLWLMARYCSKFDYTKSPPTPIIPIDPAINQALNIPYFPNIKIACGNFKSGYSDALEYVIAPTGFGRIDENRHFVARASGNSMNGGKSPIYDGDYLLLEQITSENAAKLTNETIAIERQDESGDNQYLLRKVLKSPEGAYILRANNPGYEDMTASDEMVTFARFKGKVEGLDMFVGKTYMREGIPELFGVSFNPGNWKAGHIVLADVGVQVLLVTLNKQGKSAEHRYHDFFIDQTKFHWQSQNSTKPESGKGKKIIYHDQLGIKTYLFVREHKLLKGKASPFVFYGEVNYLSHTGSAPMSVEWEIKTPIAPS